MTAQKLVVHVQFHAPGSSKGKTTLSNGVRYHYILRGIHPCMLRIESRESAPAAAPGDILIPLEHVLDAADVRGGPTGVLVATISRAAEECAKSGVPLLIDWAGGQAATQAEFLALTRFDQVLDDLGFRSYSVTLTTSSADSILQAARSLDLISKVAPKFRRVVAFNERDGNFANFPAESPEAKAYGGALLPAIAKSALRLTIPRIRGLALAPFESASLSLPDVFEKSTAELADRTGMTRMAVNACVANVAAWWTVVDAEIENMLKVSE
jgi:hypothetical protein